MGGGLAVRHSKSACSCVGDGGPANGYKTGAANVAPEAVPPDTQRQRKRPETSHVLTDGVRLAHPSEY